MQQKKVGMAHFRLIENHPRNEDKQHDALCDCQEYMKCEEGMVSQFRLNAMHAFLQPWDIRIQELGKQKFNELGAQMNDQYVIAYNMRVWFKAEAERILEIVQEVVSKDMLERYAKWRNNKGDRLQWLVSKMG